MTAKTITRSYPVQVEHEGKVYPANKDVALPEEKARKLETRYSLEPAGGSSEKASAVKSGGDKPSDEKS